MKPGRQWEKILHDHITSESIKNLDNFKSSKVNHKIALWNPDTNGLRYLKMLIYNLFNTLTDNQKNILFNCKKRDFGNPVSVKREGEDICLDYIQSCLEVDFIDKYTTLDSKSILEIGAGYGRTCHAIVSNFNVCTYTICDIGSCLELSKRYLKEVLDGADYQKIKFIDPTSLFKSRLEFDLCINIDSFSEMEKRHVLLYLEFIEKKCKNLYTKNPVGKYADSEITGDKDPEAIRFASNSGILNDILEIHDEVSVLENSKKFLESYRPGGSWVVCSHSWSPPISYYWQAIYKKRDIKTEEL